MKRTISIEEVPQEYEDIKILLRRISREDLPTLELDDIYRSRGSSRLKLTFPNQLQRRCGEMLKNSLQDQFSEPRIWDNMMDEFLEQVDGSNSTQTVNSIIHHSYSTPDHQTATQSFAGFLLRLSLRLSLTHWFGILWELHHHDLDELEIQYLRFCRKRDCDVRAGLKIFHDSDRTISGLRKKNSLAIKSLFLARNFDPSTGLPADQFEIHKLRMTLMTKFGQPLSDKLSFSDFCVLLTSFSEHYSRDQTRNVEITTPNTENPNVLLRWPLPSTIGLNAILQSHRVRLDSKIDCMIKNFVESRTSTILACKGDSLPYPEELEKESDIDMHCAFYAVPGCGKTRAIETLLSRNWGFFFTAGSLPVTKNDTKRTLASDSNIYDPRREGYSKDLYYLWMTIKTCFQMFPSDGRRLVDSQTLDYLNDFVVHSRIIVFERFLSIFPDATPADWLEFQRDFDPFSPLFWLLVLQLPSLSAGITDPWSEIRDKKISSIRKRFWIKGIRKIFVVLDEAQHDFDAKLFLGISPVYSRSIEEEQNQDFKMIDVFNGIQYSFELQFRGWARHVPIEVTKIYSGTSLRMDEMKAYLETQCYSNYTEYIVHSNFPLLRSEKEFKRLLDESEFNAESGLDPVQVELIERCGRRLRGRYLWSTLYIDQLKSFELRRLDEAAIQKAASDVASRAKDDLKKRLTRLHNQSPAVPKTQRLLDHLCWIVINCDLLDRPKTIALEEYDALVDQGFAIVSKESENKGSLEESLAMEAALEWFRTNQPGLMQRKMLEVMQISVLDDSNLGNAAEWFLAFELYNLFQDQEDRLLGSLRLQRREKVLKQLFKAQPMFETANNLDLDPENYRLVIGERIGYSFTGQSCRAPSDDSIESSDLDPQSRTGPLQLWEYLGSLRDPEANPRPTFYFPEHNAGPDLVFALEPINPITDKFSERILCVVQLKTAGNNFNAQKAIMTTDLSQSYLNKLPDTWSNPLPTNNTEPQAMPSRLKLGHQNMKLELQNWEGRTVIRIFIATQRESVSPEDIEAVKRKSNEVNKLNDYFILFGKAPSQNDGQSGDQDCDAHVGDLFGSDFMSLLELLKSKDTKAVIVARATPEEVEAKKEERNAERERKKMQDPIDDVFGNMFD